MATIVLITLSFIKASAIWWGIFILLISAILAAELFNTALEHVIDRLHPEIHPTIALAKDCAAGAVLVLSIASVVIFVTFLTEKFL